MPLILGTTNLLADPSYEGASLSSDVMGYYGGPLALVTDDRHSGAKAVRLTTNSASNPQGWVHLAPAGTAIPLGYRCRVSFWVKGPAGVTLRVSGRAHRADNNAAILEGLPSNAAVTLTGAWQYYEGPLWTVTSADTTATHYRPGVQAYLGSPLPAVGTQITFDDAELRREIDSAWTKQPYTLKGPKGDAGQNGAPGPASTEPGPKGDPGNLIIAVANPPTVATGSPGDYAWLPATSTLYGPKRADGTWPTGVVLKGDPGGDGQPGNTILSVTGVPANTVGRDGDYALDGTAARMYGPKANGAWPAGSLDLRGPAGDSNMAFGSVLPPTAAENDYFFDTASGVLYRWTGNAWVVIGAKTFGSTVTGNLTVSGTSTSSGFLYAPNLTGAWTAFDFGVSDGITFGNGVRDYAWKLIGTNTAAVRIRFVLGSTSTITDTVRLRGLPFTLTGEQALAGYCVDDSASARYVCSAHLVGTDVNRIYLANGQLGLGPGVPFTWATNDRFVLTGVVQINTVSA